MFQLAHLAFRLVDFLPAMTLNHDILYHEILASFNYLVGTKWAC